jgi:uncharacterized protein YdhG (YjbR/CyaY superfamily)
MANTSFSSVDEYIASRPVPVQPALQSVRSALRKALPGAEEVISYQMAAYRQHGRIVVYFAGWKEHYAIYPGSASLVAAFQDELAPYEQSKGTIRFPLSKPVPVRLIARIAKFRAQEVEARKNAKATAKKKTTRTDKKAAKKKR